MAQTHIEKEYSFFVEYLTDDINCFLFPELWEHK